MLFRTCIFKLLIMNLLDIVLFLSSVCSLLLAYSIRIDDSDYLRGILTEPAKRKTVKGLIILSLVFMILTII